MKLCGGIQSYAGRMVYTNPDTVEVRRSFRERFFSRPWRPWVRTKLIPNPLFPDPEKAFEVGDVLYMTESQFKRLTAGINGR